MKFQTMHSVTMTIIALAGNGLSTTVPAFVKAVCAKHNTDFELTTAALPEGADITLPSWTLVIRSEDMQYLKQLAKDLREALKLLPVDLCTEEE